MSIDAAIVDFSAGLLLRYFRGGALIDGAEPRISHRRDMELLKGHWAVSGPVRALVKYVLDHPHEAQSLLTFRTRIDNAVARGRINTLKTWQYQLTSGISSAIVTEEPVRSFNTGPNFILAWVLREAAAYTSRLSAWQGPSSPYLSALEQAQGDLRSVQRVEALRDPMRAISLGQRPGPGAIRTAARARQPIYRLAVEAYQLLQGLERGNPEAIKTIARSALIAPLEDWRRYELAVALAVGEALSDATGFPLELRLLGGASSEPIVTAGRYAIFWQQRTAFYEDPELEPSEILTRVALKAYGLSLGADRPDLVIADQTADVVVSIVEVKYLAGDTANARFREAMDQIVRYARGYAAQEDVHSLIDNSLIALSHGAPKLADASIKAPASVDFDGIKRNALASWAQQLVNAQQ